MWNIECGMINFAFPFRVPHFRKGVTFMLVAQIIVWVVTAYLGVGLLFGVAFVLIGAGKLDPHARAGTWGFRILILPGSVLLWPLLLPRWLFGGGQPVERNAHRVAAGERSTR
jgi:hypothetical protein